LEPAFVDLWGWFYSYAYQAHRSGDERKIRLAEIQNQAWDLLEVAPNRSLALYSEGVQLAKQLREPCWRLFYEYWQCEVFLFYLLDIQAAMNLAIKLVVEVQSKYEQCPVYGRIYRILVDAYLSTDSVGYADEITKNLNYLESTLPLDKDTWQLIEARRTSLAIDYGDYPKALMHAQIYLSRSQDNDYRMMNAYELLCKITFKLNDLTTMFEHAKAGEIYARACNRLGGISEFQVWQAVYHYTAGAEDIARRLTRTAIRRATALHNIFCPDSLYEYYNKCNAIDQSLSVRKQQLDKAIKSGSAFDEAYYNLQYCQLLGRMGRPLTQEIILAREAIKKLRKPKRFLGILDQISCGEFSKDF
jgi:hypothetical protein